MNLKRVLNLYVPVPASNTTLKLNIQGRFHDDDILKKFGNGDYIAIVQQCDKTKVKVVLANLRPNVSFYDVLLGATTSGNSK